MELPSHLWTLFLFIAFQREGIHWLFQLLLLLFSFFIGREYKYFIEVWCTFLKPEIALFQLENMTVSLCSLPKYIPRYRYLLFYSDRHQVWRGQPCVVFCRDVQYETYLAPLPFSCPWQVSLSLACVCSRAPVQLLNTADQTATPSCLALVI